MGSGCLVKPILDRFVTPTYYIGNIAPFLTLAHLKDMDKMKTTFININEFHTRQTSSMRSDILIDINITRIIKIK